MPRAARSFTLVKIENGMLVTIAHLDSDELREEIVKLDDGEVSYPVFTGDPVEIAVERQPRVIIGATQKKERKPRAKKQPNLPHVTNSPPKSNHNKSTAE